jgi:antitoxin component YwqK of YwqJK toxin-antitoxin module
MVSLCAEDDNIKFELSLCKGMKDGNMRIWNNDKLMFDAFYIKNQINGICRGWYKNGNTMFEINYDRNILHGPYYVYYPTGSLMKKAYYSNGHLKYSKFYNYNE